MDLSKSIISNYTTDLLDTCLTYSVEEFRAFVDRWRSEGVYPPCFDLASNEVIEITIRKIIVNRTDAPKHEREKAAAWLLSRGYDLTLG